MVSTQGYNRSLFVHPTFRVLASGLLLAAWMDVQKAAAQSPDPTELDALLRKAVELHQAGDLAGASDLYVEVLRRVPSAWRVRSNLGAAWAGLGRYEDAIDQYRQALQREDDPEVRRNLALALMKTGEVQEAAAEAERALVAAPSDRDALFYADMEVMNESRSTTLSNETGAVAPPILIRTFFPCDCTVCIWEIKVAGETK